MARNGTGTYSLPAGNPVTVNTTITDTWANTTLSDIATALTGSLAKDGQTSPTANLPMATYKHTGVGAASALTDYARADQVQNSAFQWLTSVSGADTITASASITPSAYASGQTFRFTSAGANTGAVTLNVSSLGAKSVTKNGTTALAAGDIPSGAVVEVVYDGTQFQLINVKVSATTQTIDNGTNDFRLTLTTGTPVTTSDVTGATTIYCTPYKGNRISLYDGSSWNLRTSAEFSLALGTLTSGKPYDVFCYDNSGTPTLEFLVWTNDTTRATALAYQDGILVKSGAATRRYLGTFYTTATTTTEDSVTKRYLWNYYNRVLRVMQKQDATASWTYGTATWRQTNNSTANQVDFVIGVAEDSISATSSQQNQSTSGGWVTDYAGFALDSVTVPTVYGAGIGNSAGYIATMSAAYKLAPVLGKHYIAALEKGNAGGVHTWYGAGQQYLSAEIQA